MDLVDRIETTRFLGLEFLLWLWFTCDITEGEVPVGDFGLVSISLEGQLSLLDPRTDTERVLVRGADPCTSPEADQALRSGKLPNQAVVRLIKGEMEWLATVNGQTLGLTSVRLPALLKEGDEERFLERMELLEQLHDMIEALYAMFIRARLTEGWQAQLVPALELWVRGSMDWTAEQHAAFHQAAV